MRFTLICLVMLALSGCGGSSSAPNQTSPDVLQDEDNQPTSPEGSNTAVPTDPGSSELFDVSGSNFYYTANNSARLQGELFGRGQVDNSLLRKSLDFTVMVPNNSIEVRAAYLVRHTVQSDSTTLVSDEGIVITIVRNRSADFVCSIDLNDQILMDSAGTELDTKGNTDASGVHGTVFSRVFSNCAAPNEDVYVISDNLRANYDSASRLVIGSVGGTLSGNPLTPGFVATAYHLETDTGEMKITVPNYRSEPWSAFLADLIVLDNSGAPIGYTSLADTPTSFEGSVAPGEIGFITENIFTTQDNMSGSFAGTASALRITFLSR